ncbi:hypothetical protein FA10DRAFT_266381 [Acaromyces ingoldii]|uniref:CAP-Gly domain-containing protein n=1 Tax=Acaromyces ingoldii TaxID=215250 RepID=A0A316YP54_9BASI|nr:hypothetical protein FA10DRAFT_266381 [Acaromyces ingoldii]PWN89833.1 hypothetical protein FA10DRAFT_266381 [Acaromyces ingoldii]
MALPAVGQRFSQGSSRGTVRYVGPVPPTAGVWLGVEWDDASRGKHDGVHGGTRYFTCRIKGSGSFIRPTNKVSYGSSFLKALRHKYVGAYKQPSPDERIAYSRRNLAEIEVEMPNMDAVAKRAEKLGKLREVGLGGWRRVEGAEETAEDQVEVARAYDDDEEEVEGKKIAETCANIRWLDLSRSLLPSWAELSRIAIGLRHLDTLVLHFNRFAELVEDSDDSIQSGAFASVKDLRLDGCVIDWEQVARLSWHFPNLEVLQLGSNRINHLGGRPDVPVFPRLRMLNLEGNELHEWSELAHSLGTLPNLDRLILSSNKISSIGAPEPETGKLFVTLRHVSLVDNPIASWSDLENLDRWVAGGIQSLSIGGDSCPLTSGVDSKDLRPLAIARLGRLEHLNGAEIKPVERRDAELFYLSTVQKETGFSPQQHPRVQFLMDKHGVTAATPQEKTDAGTLRSKLLTLRVHLCRAAPTANAPHLVQLVRSADVDLLTTVPLRALRTKMARSVGLSGGAKAISALWALLGPHIDAEQATAQALRDEMRPNDAAAAAAAEERIVYEMDEAGKDLRDYNLSRGDEIVIVSEDAAAA